MMKQYYTVDREKNYEEAQKRIKDAMQRGEKYVYLPGKNNCNEFAWVATWDTILRLKDDGFKIDVVWEPYEYWSVEWGY